MNLFKHKPTSLTVGNNLKVMYSFFSFHPDFERADVDTNTTDPIDFLIARNPYARVVSCFFNKCRSHIGPDKPVEICQTLIMEAMRADDRPITDRDELANLDFPSFCRLLIRLQDTNGHFWPQTHGFDFARVKQVVQMETGLPELGKNLNVDFSVTVNATEHGDWEDYYDTISKHVVRKIYAEDFEKLGYTP